MAQVQMQVPEEMQGGVYANLAMVWHTPYEFTLDFAVTQPTAVDADGNALVPATLVARVKFPPTQLFQLMQAINDNMGKYESQFGAISAPGTPSVPPDGPPQM